MSTRHYTVRCRIYNYEIAARYDSVSRHFPDLKSAKKFARVAARIADKRAKEERLTDEEQEMEYDICPGNGYVLSATLLKVNETVLAI